MSVADHPIAGSADLDALRSLLRDAAGPVRFARTTFGGEIEVGFGDERTDLFGRASPSWLIGTQASAWRLLLPDGAGSLSSADARSGERLGEQLLERRITELDLSANGLDLKIDFDDRSEMWVEAKANLDALASPYAEPPYWELFTPRDTVVAVGPGPGWLEYPADVPENRVPLPGFPAMIDPRIRAVVRLNRDLERRLEAASRRFERSQRRLAYLSSAAGLICAAPWPSAARCSTRRVARARRARCSAGTTC